MRRVAEGLQGVAKGVRVCEWKDAPEDGDAADNPAVLVRTKSGIRALFAEMAYTSVSQADSTLLTPDSFSNVVGSEPSSTLSLGLGLGLAVKRFRELPRDAGRGDHSASTGPYGGMLGRPGTHQRYFGRIIC